MATMTVPATHDMVPARDVVPGDYVPTRGRWAEVFQTRRVGDYVWLRFYGEAHTDVLPMDVLLPLT